jgi:hypothetical protein
MTEKRKREDIDLTRLLACEFLITDMGQRRARGVNQHYLISTSQTATTEISKCITVSLLPAYKQAILPKFILVCFGTQNTFSCENEVIPLQC